MRILQTPARVTVNVVRNNNAPVFQDEPYTRSVGDSSNTGTLVLTLRATDLDAPPFGTVKVRQTLPVTGNQVTLPERNKCGIREYPI